MNRIRCLLLGFVVASCATSNKSLVETKGRERMSSLDQESQNNINSLIEMIEERAKVTDPSQKHYIPYEFRIPLDSGKREQVHRIDPSIHFTPRTDSYQCIGDNATKERVFEIVALPFTYKIKFCPYE